MAEQSDSNELDEATIHRLKNLLSTKFRNGAEEDTEHSLDGNSSESRKGSAVVFQSTATLAASVKRWKLRSREGKRKQTIAVNERHHAEMATISDRITKEVPRPLLLVIQQEARYIIQRTAQDYKSILGPKHKLTQEAFEYLEFLKHEAS